MDPAPQPKNSFSIARIAVEVHSTRVELGKAAGLAAAAELRTVLRRQGSARVIFACAPSQNEFLATLVAQPNIAWDRVEALHMDEYVGLPGGHPASFRNYLRTHLAASVPLGRMHELAGDAVVAADECRRYADLLRTAPIDLVALGIGENGHLAFNDPPVADFADPLLVKQVELDLPCRAQQVHDGCFPVLAAVPLHALTLTVPALLAAARLLCMVPGPRKATAVAATLRGPITTACPASALRTHGHVRLYLDRDSAGQLAERPAGT